MRIVFMGTPDFAVPSLEAVASAHDVALVVTRPDAVRGRGKALVASPVKAKALELGIPVLEASRMTPEAKAAVIAAAPDILCVVAYGCILPDDLLAVPAHGAINVHASLLPRWRGAAPIQRAILAGDERTGVSIMRVAHDLDAGAWCRQASTEVAEKGETELTAELAQMGAVELLAALADIEAGRDVWTEQDESQVTLAAKVTKQEMRLDPADAAHVNALRVQASGDTAPARMALAGRGVRVMSAAEREGHGSLAAGEVAVERGRVFLGCAEGALELLSVKPDGKKEMQVSAWAAGLRGELSWERA